MAKPEKKTKKKTTTATAKKATAGSLAVKYRPQTLDDLIGQDAVATQVRGMVKSGRFPSTIGLFGESGAGKTTTARMIARYINCLEPNKEEGTPCGECISCKYGKEHPDLHELNMADNRGIDDIRALIQSARSMPSLGNKRIFILDEVHSCFPSGTRVVLADGNHRAIEEIGAMVDAGQDVEVLAYNTETGAREPKKVTHFIKKRSQAADMVSIRLEQLGAEAYIDCTMDHKIWERNAREMIRADKLDSKSELLCQHDIPTNVLEVTRHEVAKNEDEGIENEELEVYDLTVEGHHNYYVIPVGAASGILVSNCTPQAFQTLLKPLEDAPEHTVWILATTNPEKIPTTILGRCHKFQIKPIPEEDIIKRLRVIGKKEGVDFKEMEGGKDILKTIANMANGRMRDSIQALEGVLFAIASGQEFTSKDLIANFARSADADLDEAAARFLCSVLAGKPKPAMHTILQANNARGLLAKTRWLTHSLIQQAVGLNFFKTYSWRKFADYAKTNKVTVKLSVLLEFQDALCTIELQLNSCSIDENVLMTSRIGRFLADHKTDGAE